MMTKKLMIWVSYFLITCSASANNEAPEYETLSDSIEIYKTLIYKADSCYMKKNFELASNFFDKAFSLGVKPAEVDLYNGACAAAINGNESLAFNRLFARVQLYPQWYSDRIGQDKDLLSLHSSQKWKILCDTLQARKLFIERNYDHKLKERLDSIHYRDQMPRHAYLAALRDFPHDTLLVKTRLVEMQRNDSINQIEIFDILDKYGWPSSKIVGQSNFAIWEVIQHTSLDAIEKYLPLFHKVAADNELNKSFIAMMEDRCDMWRNRPQKYGTQLILNDSGIRVPYTLLDSDKVDEWRAEMGLPPMKEYLKQMNRQ
ncbi:MAG: hypothetical protein HDS14_06635 [Bacteroides sp.]|nr:hypothetical protein [Bacteroides sp.]